MDEFKDTKSILLMSEGVSEKKLEAIFQRAMQRHKKMPEILDGEETQDLLKIGRNSLFKLRSSGKIPYYKTDGIIVYKRSEIMTYIEKHKHNKF